MLALTLAMTLDACQSGSTRVITEIDSTEVANAIEAVWRNMIAGAQTLNPDRIRASYVEQPVVVINGRIIDDFDRDQFVATRRWLRSLRQFEGTYDRVRLQVLSADAAVATMNHHLRWTDTLGTSGQWNSAWTAVFRQVDGRWKITYSHESTDQPEDR
jgi:uncharacterized protein (TIGR02246 family)